MILKFKKIGFLFPISPVDTEATIQTNTQKIGIHTPIYDEKKRHRKKTVVIFTHSHSNTLTTVDCAYTDTFVHIAHVPTICIWGNSILLSTQNRLFETKFFLLDSSSVFFILFHFVSSHTRSFQAANFPCVFPPVSFLSLHSSHIRICINMWCVGIYTYIVFYFIFFSSLVWVDDAHSS